MPPSKSPPSKLKSKTPAKVKTPAKTKSPVKAKSTTKAKMPTKARSPAKAKSPVKSETAKATESAMIVRDSRPIIPMEFTIFKKMPLELQLIVWKYSHTSRIVTLKPSKTQFPALLHACSDSRRECILAGYQAFIRDMKTGLVFSPWRDILLLDRTSFSDSVKFHIDSFHTIKCRKFDLKMLAPVEKLAFSLREVMEIWKTQCFHCFLMNKVPAYFPNLKELIIILRPGPLGVTHDDMYEVTDHPLKYIRDFIVDVTKTFNNAQEDGKCKGIKLTLMRTETWAN
ncbi:hypothetical protein VTL71DRAFT_507 [Oculimacula yallundae]|uniref:2EXR domain-containing protein n=1 Tax=Oculimacula yallundae TaxID=86028 RepID=A0ABR4D094_9HELO